MKFETIKYEKDGPLAWITLNRPEKLNAISQTMAAEILLATDKAQCDDEVSVILVKGEGRAFSAGFDLEPEPEEEQDEDEKLQALKLELHHDFDLIMRALAARWSLRSPVTSPLPPPAAVSANRK
jgi:enoyl-CoA hydratase/carnithine racemase